MRRADIKLHSLRREDIIQFFQFFAQIHSFQRGIAVTRHFHIVADNQIRTQTGNVGPYSLGQHGRIPQFHIAADGELIGRPLVKAFRFKVPGQRMLLNNPFDIAHHFFSQRMVGRHYQNPGGAFAV